MVLLLGVHLIFVHLILGLINYVIVLLMVVHLTVVLLIFTLHMHGTSWYRQIGNTLRSRYAYRYLGIMLEQQGVPL